VPDSVNTCCAISVEVQTKLQMKKRRTPGISCLKLRYNAPICSDWYQATALRPQEHDSRKSLPKSRVIMETAPNCISAIPVHSHDLERLSRIYQAQP
jgi:hypothetical protein